MSDYYEMQIEDLKDQLEDAEQEIKKLKVELADKDVALEFHSGRKYWSAPYRGQIGFQLLAKYKA